MARCTVEASVQWPRSSTRQTAFTMTLLMLFPRESRRRIWLFPSTPDHQRRNPIMEEHKYVLLDALLGFMILRRKSTVLIYCRSDVFVLRQEPRQLKQLFDYQFLRVISYSPSIWVVFLTMRTLSLSSHWLFNLPWLSSRFTADLICSDSR